MQMQMRNPKPQPHISFVVLRAQRAWLVAAARRQEITLSELLRRIIDQHIKREQSNG